MSRDREAYFWFKVIMMGIAICIALTVLCGSCLMLGTCANVFVKIADQDKQQQSQDFGSGSLYQYGR